MDLSNNLVRGFCTPCGNEAEIGNFRYRITPNFDQWVLWTGDGSSGFCAVEPMQGAVNALNSGTGAAAIAIVKLLLAAGFKNITMCDRKGAIYEGRDGLNWIKEEMALQAS